jgi:DNA-binding NtrC family response regulator
MELSPKIRKAATLLVDDDQLIRDSMRLAFRNQVRFIQVVESAEEALRILEKVSFDIIISDFKLPGLNGLEFLKQVRISHPKAVTILISANGNDQVIENAYEIGVHDFLQKPFSLKTLWATLAMHVQKRNGGKKPSKKIAKKARKRTTRKSDTHDTTTGPKLSSLKLVDGEAQI